MLLFPRLLWSRVLLCTDTCHVRVIHMSAQEDLAFVVSKVCSRSAPRLSPLFLRRITSHFPDLLITTFMLERLIVTSRGCQSDCQERKQKVLLLCGSVQLNSAEGSGIRSL